MQLIMTWLKIFINQHILINILNKFYNDKLTDIKAPKLKMVEDKEVPEVIWKIYILVYHMIIFF